MSGGMPPPLDLLADLPRLHLRFGGKLINQGGFADAARSGKGGRLSRQQLPHLFQSPIFQNAYK